MTGYIYSPVNFEQDKALLNYVDTLQVKEHYIKIHIFNPHTGEDIGDIEGVVTQGSISVNGNSSIRRTGSLTLVVPDEKIFGLQFGGKTIHKVTDLNNLIAINKRARIYVGYSNTGHQYTNYSKFWFPLGEFVLENPSVTHSNAGVQVQVKLSDKMTLLNGTNGGELQQSITHVGKNDKILILDVLKTLLYEMGGLTENDEVEISDIGTEIENNIILWNNSEQNVYCYDGENANEKRLSLILPEDVNEYDIIKFKEPLGVRDVDFHYPGELTSNAGESIVSVLDKIKKTLGNYEYFFDTEGKFHFQRIKNFIDEGATPDDLTTAINEKYFFNQTNKASLSLTNSKIISSYSNAPNFSKVKNNLVLWGKDTNSQLGIRYHLLIDKCPTDDQNDITYYFDWYTDDFGVQRVLSAGTEKNAFSSSVIAKDWRHKMYFDAIIKQPNTTALEKEIIEELPKIFDVIGGTAGFINESEPFLTSYWLDRINVNELNYDSDEQDRVTDTIIQQMAIADIGDRPKTFNDDKINCLFAPKTPNLKLYKEGEIPTTNGLYTIVESELESSLSIGTVYNPAFEYIRSVLHEYTGANNTISLSTLPMYYLEPNIRIEVEDDNSDIHGEYIINSLTMPLTVNGMMTIQAAKAAERI